MVECVELCGELQQIVEGVQGAHACGMVCSVELCGAMQCSAARHSLYSERASVYRQ